MAKETKIGLALCVLLIGAFGFVVYSKMHKQRQLDDDYVAASDDSDNDDKPFQEDDGELPDFGSEPGHVHAQNLRKSTFTNDDRSTADNFDIPQRTARRDVRKEFQRVESLKQQHQHGAEDWKVQTVADKSPGHHAQQGDNPFAQTSHEHSHDETPNPFGDDDPHDDFGPGKHRHAEQQTASQSKKTLDITEFLKGRDNDDAVHVERHAATGADDEPFGLAPVETAQNETHRHQSEPVDEFNPFDSPDPEPNHGHDFGEHPAQQTAGRTAVESRHQHQHSHDVFGDEPDGDAWSPEQSDGHVHSVDTRHSGQFQAGSTTKVQSWDDSEQSFDSFDAASGSEAGTVSHRQEFDGGFGDDRPAPRPEQHGRHEALDDHFQQNDPAPDRFSQPFDDSEQQQHGHAADGRVAPETNDAHGDRPAIYVARQGDSFWNISKKQYGAGRYYKLLALYNKGRIPDPRKLRPGMKVLVPQPETLEARYPTLCPWRSARPADVHHGPGAASGFFVDSHGEPRYRVGKRDTLTDIARIHLGRSSRWKQVYTLNRDRIRDARRLQIGTILRLPADASRVDLVRRGGGRGSSDVGNW